MLNKFKSLSKLSKTAVIYSILVCVYEFIKAIAYVVSFAKECAQYGESISSYWGYLLNGILDTYVVVPAGLIILVLLCVKIIEGNKPEQETKEGKGFFRTLVDKTAQTPITDEPQQTEGDVQDLEETKIEEQAQIEEAAAEEALPSE